MTASLKRDYAQIRQAGAELVVVCPDSPKEHCDYALSQFGEELPYLYVSDSDLRVARAYGLLRKEEHRHGGFYQRSLWSIDPETVVLHKILPWKGNVDVEEYERLFDLIDGRHNADRRSGL